MKRNKSARSPHLLQVLFRYFASIMRYFRARYGKREKATLLNVIYNTRCPLSQCLFREIRARLSMCFACTFMQNMGIFYCDSIFCNLFCRNTFMQRRFFEFLFQRVCFFSERFSGRQEYVFMEKLFKTVSTIVFQFLDSTLLVFFFSFYFDVELNSTEKQYICTHS